MKTTGAMAVGGRAVGKQVHFLSGGFLLPLLLIEQRMT